MAKYSDFVNNFSKVLDLKQTKYLDINIYTINPELTKKLFYILINSLDKLELEIPKIYIKINFHNSFIKLLKSFARVSILYVRKLDNSNYLYINYYDLINLSIKNL